jgi:transposase
MAELNKYSKLSRCSDQERQPAVQGSKAKKKRSRPSQRKDPTAGLPPINLNAAAIDVGSAEHWAAIPPGRAQVAVRRFGCTTEELQQLATWFKEQQIDTVVMEATGNYWVVLFDLLEEQKLNPVLVNPRYAKNTSGKKGDLIDCVWMQKLHTFGLFANSFRPAEPIRVLRAYQRQREELVRSAAQAIQHMQKALTEMNIQLTNVIADISGETGLAIIDAILAGERDFKALATLRNPRCKSSLSTIAGALRGYWKAEQLFILEQARLSYAHYQEQICQCDERIQQQMRTLQSRFPQPPAQTPTDGPAEKASEAVGFDLSAELRRVVGVDLTAVDGMGPVTAQVVLSEVGTDMSPWPSEKHFASWLGLCPDHRISGGRILGRSTRPVVSRARNALRLAAYTLERSESWLGAKYRRLKRKLGAPKAITAMAHHLARLIYRLIKYGQEYVDKGIEAYETKYREQRIKWLTKQAQELNLKLVGA